MEAFRAYSLEPIQKSPGGPPLAPLPLCAVLRLHDKPDRLLRPLRRSEATTAELPIVALRLPSETVNALRRLGIERIGQLAAMPSAPLTRRFGAEVRRRLDQALGHAAEPFDALMPPEIIRRRLAFSEPIGAREDLSRVMRRAWVAFAAEGDPNTSGVPLWEASRPADDNHLELGDELRPGAGWRRAQLDFLERFYRSRGS